MTTETEPLYSEKKVMELLGISPYDFRTIRRKQLAELVHWTKLSSGAIALTHVGLVKVIDYLWTNEGSAPVANPLLPNEFGECIVDSRPLRKEPEWTELIVVRLPPNRRMLVCRFPGSTLRSLEVRCKVSKQENFRPKMVLKTCRPHPVVPGMYEYQGRLPRKRGRW